MMKNIFYIFKETFLEIFLPPICVICESKEGKMLCEACFRKIKFVDEFQKCPRCSLVFYDSVPEKCPNCERLSPKFSKLVSIFVYEEYGEKLIRKIKFENKLKVVEEFSDMIKSKLEEIDFDIVVPIPSYTRKWIKKGYIPSVKIAKVISENLRKPIVPLIRKSKEIPSQLELSSEERLKNPKDAFEVIGSEINYRRILLVDDVATTTATLCECTRILLEKGADEVFCFSLARTPLKTL